MQHSTLNRVTKPQDVAELVTLVLDRAMTLAPGSVLRADGGHRLLAGGPVAPR